ncbi:ATP-binding cassette domain-containing protein [Pseudomonas sp. CCI3.2]|uniref:ABC transporter ATP-binding protein n=1 Tax=unclassified Pseudomonas TaxID=196821 RepID=UPI002AC91864|nr:MULTISPECIES: ATP-binding cassette domain-containing protein [unclassified Pseudomonas]MEB0078429.1 ATP-binding cassette domain-containing protein [Pseudomonas sp. MH10out]MEB0090165.1 ATP-binding cassette domain-containing protein [Pseudomonas sp. CCI4.2]MEB0102901.1 ATP-binding cassette domain-containing protein [Pseudomonas sp. CCI3.2]MEB0131788.1 ATP-binding cassette domain-containing protein [Pseudomonas sp. CCI2.4]MEB0158052.1 ATP-binding cassette domain-containing protein [Pseudomona
MTLSPPKPTPATPRQILLNATGLVRYNAKSKTHLLNCVDFSLAAGDRVAVTGPSGSGKSVFLRALALLDSLDAGQIFWRNTRVSGAAIPAFRRHVSYIAQRPAMLEGTVEDNLRYPFSLKVYNDLHFDRDAAVRLAKQAGRDDSFLDKQSSELSGGEAQIAALIRVLQLQPDVLLLDEPTAALDPESSQEIEALVTAWFNATNDNGRAYLWVSHDQAQAQRMSGRQLTMLAGTLSEETP